MKMLIGGLVMSLGVLSSSVNAEVLVDVEGKTYKLTDLMENCQSMSDNPVAQVSCFSAVSALLESQSTPTPTESSASIPEAFEALRDVAQYVDEGSGLIIRGAECNAQFLYFGNYFHVSRRNLSSLDLFSTQIDASKVDYDQIVQTTGNQVYMSRGTMLDGSVAKTSGGLAIESAQYNIAAKPARMTIADYAVQVAGQLTAKESNEFDFVLVHPAKQQSSAAVWGAFKTYIEACQG